MSLETLKTLSSIESMDDMEDTTVWIVMEYFEYWVPRLFLFVCLVCFMVYQSFALEMKQKRRRELDAKNAEIQKKEEEMKRSPETWISQSGDTLFQLHRKPNETQISPYHCSVEGTLIGHFDDAGVIYGTLRYVMGLIR